MVSRELARVVRHLRRLARPADEAARTDAELVKTFAERHDEAAFEALLTRHGPMVLGLCQRLLRNSHDAEDAFQATFLVLVRKAGSLRERDLLGNWLYGVAYRIAVRLRASNARRQARERLDSDRAAGATCPEPRDQELGWLLQEELGRLPDKYRRPVVLCYVEGHTNEEAARQLSWPLGTVKGRLTRARELLRRRLTRRGVQLSSAALAAALSQTPVQALPPPLIVSTVKVAQALATGKAAALGGLSPAVLALVQGFLSAARIARATRLTVLAVTLAVLMPGAGLLLSGPVGENPPAAKALARAQTPDAKPLTDSVELKAAFTPGRPFYLEYSSTTKQVTTVMHREHTQPGSQIYRTLWTPLSKKDGVVAVKVKILDVQVDMGLGSDRIRYDSRAPSKEQTDNPLATFAKKLSGSEHTLWLNDDPKSDKYGTVLKSEGEQVRLPRQQPTSLPGLLWHEVAKSWSSPLDGMLPGRVVRKGETWSAVERQDRGDLGECLRSSNFTYEGPAGGLDRIRVTSTLRFTPSRDRQSGRSFRRVKTDLKSRDSQGIFLFDRFRGRIAEATLDTTIEGTLEVEMEGMNTTVGLVQTERITVKTRDAEKPAARSGRYITARAAGSALTVNLRSSVRTSSERRSSPN
jgi:RNA polymerase sigma factor (sigma-70 family)